MTAAELHWLAGWLEGEGSFMFCRAVVKETGYVKHNFAIAAASTDKDVIDRAASLLEVNVRGPYRQKANHREYWVFRLGARDDVLAWCRRLRPMMGERRQAQIDKVLAADIEYPRRRTGVHTGRKHEYENR